jgi:hypothetical protein
MDDIARDVSSAQARDVVQRQAPHEPHNEYVVAETTTPRFPWHGLDRDIQEQILQDAQPHARRYFTNPGGGFNWAELERGVRARILQNLQEATRRRVSWRHMAYQNWPVPYYNTSRRAWMSQRIRNIEHLPMWFTLSFERIPASVLDVAPQMTVTFSTQLRPEEFLTHQAHGRRRHNTADNEFRELSASELESLRAQMDRTIHWRNVHTIRVIAWPINGPQASPGDEFSFEFVSTDQHGNEVTSTLDSIYAHRDHKNRLEHNFYYRLGLRGTRVHLATPRRRMVPDYGWTGSEFSRTEAVEWRVPRV